MIIELPCGIWLNNNEGYYSIHRSEEDATVRWKDKLHIFDTEAEFKAFYTGLTIQKDDQARMFAATVWGWCGCAPGLVYELNWHRDGSNFFYNGKHLGRIDSKGQFTS